MQQLTPKNYWRVACQSVELERAPAPQLVWPSCIATQTSPPRAGDGVLLAAYDQESQMGLIGHLGIVSETANGVASVEWAPAHLEIWVDTPTGRGFWQRQEGFRFASNKVPGYGLHEMFARHFEGLVVRESLPAGNRAVSYPRRLSRRGLAPERFEPAELIGEPNGATRGGYVYVLESAYGCKVGRTRNLPQRLHAFGVKLPIAYTVRLCAWFDDHYEAETRYHQLFRDKHVNGEWFALDAADIELIRARTFEARGMAG